VLSILTIALGVALGCCLFNYPGKTLACGGLVVLALLAMAAFVIGLSVH
jgi:hypothetical protein